jgi:Ca-activated chloride channel family protein
MVSNMDELHFVNKAILGLLSLIPVLGLLLYFGYWRKDRRLLLFAEAKLLSQIRGPVSWHIRLGKILLFCLASALLLVALARPCWGIYLEKLPQKERDLVVLLDVSKSMLSEDVRPSRLERAKMDLRDLVASLNGDRVGLVVFAGEAQIRCPLTRDYQSFRQVLDECDPSMLALGGTCLGDAMRKATLLLASKEERTAVSEAGWLTRLLLWFSGTSEQQEETYGLVRNKAMLLITDGEDHASAPLEAAQLAKTHHIRIFTVGLGDPKEGSQIPLTETSGFRAYQTDKEGQVVWSRLNENLLGQIALQSDGAYLPVRTREAGLLEFYRRHIARLATAAHLQGTQQKSRERFQWFLALALLLLFAECLLREGKKHRLRAVMPVFLLIFAVLVSGCGESEDSPGDLTRQGNELYHVGQWEKAKEKYQAALQKLPGHPFLLYDQGNCQYREKEWDKALSHYQEARREDEHLYEATAHRYRIYFNAGCAWYGKALQKIGKQAAANDLLQSLGMLNDSLETFRQALQAKPNDNDTLANISVVKHAMQEILEKIRQQRQEEDKQKNSAMALLNEIRQKERALIRQIRGRLLSGKPLPDLAVSQRDIKERLTALPERLQQEMGQSLAQQPPQPQQSTDAEKIKQQAAQAIAFMLEFVSNAEAAMTEAAQQLADNKSDSLTHARESLDRLNMLWQLLAQPPQILGDDIALERSIVGDIGTLAGDASDDRPWQWTGEDQREAADLTQLFLSRLNMQEKMTPQPGDPKHKKSPEEKKKKRRPEARQKKSGRKQKKRQQRRLPSSRKHLNSWVSTSKRRHSSPPKKRSNCCRN